jgi:hypothetical protein
MATAHLLFGFLGSGKTTLAKELEERHRAMRFTPDEWMARLFGEDPPVAIFKERRPPSSISWNRCGRAACALVLMLCWTTGFGAAPSEIMFAVL